jgi:hypothetical protein
MNDLQSVVRRATCEWREGVQHGSLRYESGCKLCCKCGKLNKLIYLNLCHTIATQGQWVGLFLCLACWGGKNKRPLNAARTTMQASWKVGSRWTESGWNEWSWIVRNETK